MNVYEIEFTCSCPKNGDKVSYHLELSTCHVVFAEDLQSACDTFEPSLHEDLADVLHHAFGGHQVLSATHRSVRITTIRG